MPTSSGLVIVLCAAGAAAGCRHFQELATIYGRETDVALAEARRGSEVANEECLLEARLMYHQTRLGIGPEGPGAPVRSWPAWLADTGTPASPTAGNESWASYCGKLDDTGKLFNDAIAVLREYGNSILALSAAKDFDASGLQTGATSGASIAASLGASSAITSAGSSIGAALPALGQFAGNQIRSHELESYVGKADPVVQPIFRQMILYLETLEAELTRIESHRKGVVEMLARTELAGAPPWTEANAGELISDSGRRLGALRRQLALVKTILSLCADAHGRLASHTDGKQTEAALKRFQIELGTLRASRDWR